MSIHQYDEAKDYMVYEYLSRLQDEEREERKMEERILELERQLKEKEDRIKQLECALSVSKKNIFQYVNPSLKLLRYANNMTLEEASQELGITTATLSKLENNTNAPTKAMLALMGKVYNFPDDQIFTVFQPKEKNE